MPRKHQDQIHQTRSPGYFLCLAAHTFREASRLKVPWAHGAIRLMDQAPIGANRLIRMMLDHRWFSQQPSHKERHKRGSCKVKKIRVSKQTPKGSELGPPDYAKGQQAIIENACRNP